MASPLLVACIVAPVLQAPPPGIPHASYEPRQDMSCLGPFSEVFLKANKVNTAAEFIKADIAHDPKGAPMITYELRPHTAKLSVEPKELGEIKPDGNPEKGRVRIPLGVGRRGRTRQMEFGNARADGSQRT